MEDSFSLRMKGRLHWVMSFFELLIKKQIISQGLYDKTVFVHLKDMFISLEEYNKRQGTLEVLITKIAGNTSKMSERDVGNLKKALLSIATRIKECQGCSNIFFKGADKRQKYCSRKCVSAAGIKRFRMKKHE